MTLRITGLMSALSLALLLVVVLAGGGPALAMAALDTAIGNTVSITTDGVETRYYFNENGSVSLANSKGDADIGTWSSKDQQLCVNWASQNAPVCLPLTGLEANVGDTVTLTGGDGAAQKATFMGGKVPF